MFGLSRLAGRILPTTWRRFFSATSFEVLAKEHKILADNLQKIAEADRKFVSFEVEGKIGSNIKARDLGHTDWHC